MPKRFPVSLAYSYAGEATNNDVEVYISEQRH
jgi:hypothetical protein